MAKTEKVAKPKTERKRTVKTAVTAPQSAPAVAVSGEAVVAVSEVEIARRAFEVYCARGGEPGRALEDWLQAERELTAAASNGH